MIYFKTEYICIYIWMIFQTQILFVFVWSLIKGTLKTQYALLCSQLDAIFPSQTIARECKDKPHDNIQNVHSQLVNMWNIHVVRMWTMNIDMGLRQLLCFHMCTHRGQLSYQQPVQKSKQLCQPPGQITEEVDFVKLQICWNSDQRTIKVEPLKFVSELALSTLAANIVVLTLWLSIFQATNRVNTVQVISSFR